ncbi:MAG: ribosome-associated translation inhibitor RaiA [Coriobacteriales bacterium]|jgi:putative sigma-54 modulation protein|nr:ribosome-associated translation inhibitor RaiA [Coriobacteriales bacterium]
MDIIVTGRKMSVSDALRAYVKEKVGNSVKVFQISPMSAEVVLRKEKNPANPKPAVAEITLFTKGHIIRTEEAEEDMYAAIDVAAAKVERQLRKYKTKVLEKRQHAPKLTEILPADALVPDDLETAAINGTLSGGSGFAGANSNGSAAGGVLEHVVDVEDESKIVRVKEIELEALTEEEALIHIDLLGHDFFAYINDVDGLFNVLYRRKDGSYGILKPKIETLES